MSSRFVITGSGRCGTRWVAFALTASRVPTGHEAVHNAELSRDWPRGLVGDSSWMAATMLDRVTEPVALLVRHPLAVVASWVEIGFFTRDLDNPTHGPLRKFAPEVYEYASAPDRALAMWILLTSAGLARAEMLIRAEEMATSFPRLLAWAGGSSRCARDGLRIPPGNRHEASRRLTNVTHRPDWRGHDRTLAGEARHLADLLGYDDMPPAKDWT